MEAEKMAADPNASRSISRPRFRKCFHATRLLQPQQMDRLNITAPAKSVSPYVCTFPDIGGGCSA